MRKTQVVFVVGLAAGITLMMVVLGWSPVRIMEYVTLDWRFQLRNKLQRPAADPRIVFCGIDDQSVREIGAWPFPRNKHAELLALLADEKPTVVTWDVLFTAPKKQAPEEDDLFVEKVKPFHHFITGAAEYDAGKGENLQTSARSPDQMGPTRPLTHVTGDLSKIHQCPNASLPFDSYTRADGSPSSSLLQNSLFGFVISDPAYDGVRRSLPMIVGYQNKVYASLSLLSVLEYLHVREDDVAVNLGGEITIQRPERKMLRIPINERGEMIVNYRLNPDQFANINYFGLLYLLSCRGNPTEARTRDPDFDAKLKELPVLKGHILLFGFTAPGSDRSPTPLEKDSPLVSVHLNAIQNILKQDFLYPVPNPVSLAIIFLFLCLLGAVLLRIKVSLVALVGLFSLMGYFLFSQGLFQYFHLILPTALPMLAILLESLAITAYLYLNVDKQKEISEKRSQKLAHVLRDQVSANLTRERLRGATSIQGPGDHKDLAEVLPELAQQISAPIIGLGRYNLICKLGQGGMGAVFLGRDKVEKKFCAIKVLNPEFAEQKDATDRFLREGRSMSALSHPNLVGLFECSQFDGQYFLSMEFIEGMSLGEIIAQQGPLPAPLAFHWLRQSSVGLGYIHGKTMIHRDIKPDNMMIDASGNLRITDLGLAKDRGETNQSMTVTGTMMGSPYYMSPEQINNSKTVDHRADIYSLGITFFQMLTGRVPFEYDSPGAICVAHLQEPIPPVITPPSDFSQALDALVGRIAAKDKDLRFQDATELIAAIDPWIEMNPMDEISQQYFSRLPFENRKVEYVLRKAGVDLAQMDGDFGALAASDDLGA